jgi:hypothetical protein
MVVCGAPGPKTDPGGRHCAAASELQCPRTWIMDSSQSVRGRRPSRGHGKAAELRRVEPETEPNPRQFARLHDRWRARAWPARATARTSRPPAVSLRAGAPQHRLVAGHAVRHTHRRGGLPARRVIDGVMSSRPARAAGLLPLGDRPRLDHAGSRVRGSSTRHLAAFCAYSVDVRRRTSAACFLNGGPVLAQAREPRAFPNVDQPWGTSSSPA